jgi:hypothetical protein
VVVSENERSELEGDAEGGMDEADPESGIRNYHASGIRLLTMSRTGVGVPSRPNRKRKRTPDPRSDRISIEADDLAISFTLPRIQTNDRQRQVTPSTLVVPHRPESLDPLSPHIITDNESQDIEHQKPAPKRALKALQNAKAEVCQLVGATLDRLTWSPLSQEPKFVNSDSDDEPPAGKRHRAAAGDGKKPAIAKEDPVFGVVYKNAGLELKRHIYFVNAFPTSAESDNLPPQGLQLWR